MHLDLSALTGNIRLITFDAACFTYFVCRSSKRDSLCWQVGIIDFKTFFWKRNQLQQRMFSFRQNSGQYCPTKQRSLWPKIRNARNAKCEKAKQQPQRLFWWVLSNWKENQFKSISDLKKFEDNVPFLKLPLILRENFRDSCRDKANIVHLILPVKIRQPESSVLQVHEVNPNKHDFYPSFSSVFSSTDVIPWSADCLCSTESWIVVWKHPMSTITSEMGCNNGRNNLGTYFLCSCNCTSRTVGKQGSLFPANEVWIRIGLNQWASIASWNNQSKEVPSADAESVRALHDYRMNAMQQNTAVAIQAVYQNLLFSNVPYVFMDQ